MARSRSSSPQARRRIPQGNDLGSPDLRLSSRIESYGDFTQLGFEGDYYDGAYSPVAPSPPSSPSPRARESLVSLATQHPGSISWIDEPENKRWSAAIRGIPYQRIGIPALPTLGRPPSTHIVRYRPYVPKDKDMDQDIPEDRESMDIALLPATAAIDGSGPSVSTPTYTDSEMSIWREQEKAGQLSNGLGAGLKPERTIRETELLLSGQRDGGASLSPTLSLYRRKAPLSSTATWKVLAQRAADSYGQAVQVILEDPEFEEQKHADGSSIAWNRLLGRTTHPKNLADFKTHMEESARKKNQRTETFYPHPNWKPFSMRWPYLTILIILSVTLAGLTEALYQSSAKTPLVSFNTPQEIKTGTYFVFKFLPTIVAVTYGVMWQMTDLEVRRLEAYYQLSKKGGATAAETLNVDYITSLSFLRPLRSYRLRHYAVTISSVASLLAVSAVPTLTSACIILTPDRETRIQDPNGMKRILIDPTWSRVLEVVLYLNAVMGAVLFYQLGTRQSGLLADVKGIAGLAAMANVSHILMDFKDMDVATHKDIHHRLAGNRYILRNSSLAPLPAGENDHSTARVTGSTRSGNSEQAFNLTLNPQPLMLRAAGCVPFVTGVLLFTALLPIFLFTPASYLTDKAPWVATALAVCIKLAWGAIDTNVRMMEPFFILYKRRAAPKTLTLDYTAMPFAWVALRALANGHWLVFAVGFGTVMTEILTVLVTSLAAVEGKDFARIVKDSGGGEVGGSISSGQETANSFWISLGMATFILLYMGAVVAVVCVQRRKPFLPRQPNTIASVLAFIHQSKMLWNFVGTEKLDNREMVEFLEGVGHQYGLGWFEGRDGLEHCGIDQEELKTSYRHGLNHNLSNKPWIESFSEWL